MRDTSKTRPARKARPSGNGQLDSLAFVRASLAHVQTNVFLADPALTLIYANERALQTLRGLADEMVQQIDVALVETIEHADDHGVRAGGERTVGRRLGVHGASIQVPLGLKI